MSIFLVLFFMGLVQGLTEFLPVSSSGHLVLISNLFGVEESLFLSIILHVATLFSIIVVFWRDIIDLIKHPLSNKTIALVVATIPTCIIVLLIMPLVKSSFGGYFLPFSFFITAVLLVVTELIAKKKTTHEFTYKTAVIMGIAQGFAVFPGISRSGTTICAGILAGGEKKDCAKFSFLMSIPIVFLSLLMEIYEALTGGIHLTYPISAIILSFIVAFLSGIFAIKFMVRLTEKGKLWWFSCYLLVLALATFFML